MDNHKSGSGITELAQKLYAESGSYYGAAKRLGNPNLRASLHRLLNEEGFKPSEGFMVALWQWANIKPVIIKAHPGSSIFGKVGLLSLDQVSVLLVVSPDEWARHSMKCEACGKTTTRWHPAQKYCSTECRLRARAERKAKLTSI